MRIFIGVKLNLPKILSDVKEQISVSKVEKIQWVNKDNLHLTYFFIGQIDDENLIFLNKALRGKLKDFESFKVQIKNTGYFSKGRGKNILWLGVEDSVVLDQLHTRIVNVCCNVLPGISREFTSYIPHITLARYPRYLDLEEIFQYQISKTICIEEVQIIESKSKQTGVEYIVLERIPLFS